MNQATAGRAGLSARVFRLAKFGVVGLSGYVVNTVALALFTDLVGIHYMVGAIMATQVSTTWNYLFTDAWVFGARSNQRNHAVRFGMFWLMNNITLVLRLPLLWLLTSVLGVHYLISNMISLGIITVVRFWASDEYIWGETR